MFQTNSENLPEVQKIIKPLLNGKVKIPWDRL
jgi:hypothetical protein